MTDKPVRVALYARVSTKGQTVDNQLRELRMVAESHGWQIVEEYTDQGISGAKGREDRPAFDALCRDLMARKFDKVAAWKLDRLGRSLSDLIEFVKLVQSKRVGLYLHKDALDTSTPAGKLFFHIMGALAEFEREVIRERVAAGLARAKEKGTRSGKPIGRPKVPPKTVKAVKDAARAGKSGRQIARELRIGQTTVRRILDNA